MVALALTALAPGSFGQVAAIVTGAVAGLFLCGAGDEANAGHLAFRVSRRAGVGALIAFVALLVVPHLVATSLQS